MTRITELLDGYNTTLLELRDLRRDIVGVLQSTMPSKLFNLLCKGDVIDLEQLLSRGRTSTIPLPWYLLKSHDFQNSGDFLKALTDLEKAWEDQIGVTTEETDGGIVVYLSLKDFVED